MLTTDQQNIHTEAEDEKNDGADWTKTSDVNPTKSRWSTRLQVQKVTIENLKKNPAEYKDPSGIRKLREKYIEILKQRTQKRDEVQLIELISKNLHNTDEEAMCGNEDLILKSINDQNVVIYNDKEPLLGVVKPVFYQKAQVKGHDSSLLLCTYIFTWIVSFIMVSDSIAKNFTAREVYKILTILMFVANMLSTTDIIISLALSNVRISGLDKKNGEIVLFSMALSIIVTSIILLPWTYILEPNKHIRI